MNYKIRISLSLMMFLNFFIWGGWFVTLGTFLSNKFQSEGTQVALAFETQAWGAIIAPLIVGVFADRYFSAQKLLGVFHLIGAGLLYLAGSSSNFEVFYPYILAYMVLFMPTIALTNSIAFRQMKNPTKDFAPIRVLGTLGWVVAGFIIGRFQWEASESLENTFFLSAIAALLLGLFSFTLPNTPPSVSKKEKISIAKLFGLDALNMLKDKSYLVFFVSSILVCIPLSFYYSFANPFLNEIGLEKAAEKMAWGQISEIIFMLILPVFMLRYGIKKTILLGLFAWALRYILFAYGGVNEQTWMLIVGILLHGICYDFFFVSGQIYTETKATSNFKSSAQGLITIATYGIGMLIGFRTSGLIVEYYTSEGSSDWFNIWLVPGIFAGLVLLGFIFAFKNSNTKTNPIAHG